MQPQNRTVTEGASHTFLLTASGSAPLGYQWRKDGGDLSGATNESLALAAIQTNAAGFYSVVVSNSEGVVTSALARLTVRSTNDPAYPVPHLGWAYLYSGVGVASASTAALDGSWDHQFDSWSGDGRGTNNGLVGGLSTSNGVLTIEDGVTSTTGGTFNNRRFNFTRSMSLDAAITNANTLLSDGVTLTFRARLTPASDPWMELTNAPSGLVNNADGKGIFSIRQAGGGGMLIGFSLNQAVEDTGISTSYNFGQAGLHMNHLNGNFRTNSVDPGEAGTLNLLPLDPTAFHEFWITIQDNGNDAGTHRVSIYMDGALTPTEFNVSAGTGLDQPFTNYLALGMNATTQRGAVDVDFFGYRAGVVVPSAFNLPVGIVSGPQDQFVAAGQPAVFNVGVTGTPPYNFQWFRDGALISGATNQVYTIASAGPGDEGALFHVMVGNEFNSVTSAPPAGLHLLGAPVILVQPASVTATNGDAVTLSVTAGSSVAPTYQWRRNGSAVIGGSNATLSFNPVGAVNAGDYDVVVANGSGSVTSLVAMLAVVTFDFGDATDAGYRTARASDGARHVIHSGVYLGAGIDAEVDGSAGVGATGDDLSGVDDEDGVVFPSAWVVGESVALTVVASTNGFLNAWVDWDRNGDWLAGGEQIVTNAALVAGTNQLNLIVPSGAISGAAPARFRFDTAGGLVSFGAAADGEVEDYLVNVSPRANLGVSHLASLNPIAVNSNLNIAVSLTNAGPSLATGVMLTNTLPADAAFIGVSSSQGSCFQLGEQLVCDVGVIAASSTAAVVVTLRPLSAGSITMTSVVRSLVEDPALADNQAGSTVTVIDGPAIVLQPQGLTVTNGGAASFAVTASGTGPLSYQWFRDAQSLPGKTNAILSIASVQLADGGVYTVRITNQVGAVLSAPANLMVLVAPAITSQPASITNLAGSTAVFSIGASGSEPLLYHWRLNGVHLSADEEQASLILSPVHSTNAGAYSVIVSNAAGVVTSVVATLTVVEMDFGDAPVSFPSTLASNGARHRLLPGVFLGSAVDYEADAAVSALATGDDDNGVDDEDGVTFGGALRIGQSVSVQVVASTNGFLNAWVDFSRNQSWAQPGEQVFTNRAVVSGTNNLSFVVPAGASIGQAFARFRFAPTSGASFTGEVLGGEVEDYEVAIVSVADVSIASKSQITPIAVGSNQVYSITVSNAGPAVATSVSLSDALPAGLTFVSAASSQGACVHSAGTIACSLGSMNVGTVATVTISALIGIEGTIANAVVVGANEVDLNPTNNSANVECEALFFPLIVGQPEGVAVTNGGTATFVANAIGTALRYQWRLNGTNVAGATNGNFSVTNVQTVHEGGYTVRITNAVGGVTSAVATLSILQPVSIVSQPQNQTVLVDANAQFAVSANGTGPFTYQWTFNGADLAGQTNATLGLPGVTTNQAGVYQVRVGNVLGLVGSSNATLTVLVPPFFTAQPQGLTNPTAFPLTIFQAGVGGTAPVRVQWFFNRTNLLVLQTNLTFSITNLQASNAGSYSVVASNIAGMSTSAVAVLAVFDMDFGDAPSAQGYPTMLAVNGARHRVVAGVRLGALIDAETNGLPNASATGDDTRVLDDEDGVFLPAGLLAGSGTIVPIVASTNGFLDAWIDFNGNGSWADPGEQLFASRALVPGTNSLVFDIPSSAPAATRMARFRFSTVGGLAFDGYANDGEVEDHQVTILPSIDLVLGMVESQDPVPVSSNVTYTISVTNRGPSTAALVWVTNPVPAAVSFVSYVTSGGQGFCGTGGGVVYCLLNDMPANAGATIDLTVRANATGTYTNRAWVFSLGAAAEAASSDNTNALTTTFIGAPVGYASSTAIPVGDASAGGPGKGSPYPATITVSGLTAAVYKVTVTLSNLVHDFAKDFDILLVGPRGQNVLLMSDAGGTALANVTLAFDDAAADPLPSSGAISLGTYRPTNYGAGVDAFPTPAPAGPFGSALAVFNNTDPNGVWSLYVVDGVVGGLGSILGGWRLEITTADPIADLALTLSASTTNIALGSNLVYSITATNRGPAVGSQVRLTNALPAGVTFVSASSSSGSCVHSAGVVTCDFGTLLSGSGASVGITVLPSVSGSLTNTARLSAAQNDPVSGNNLAQSIVSARAATDLAVSQAASTNIALLGQNMSYAVVITNRGPNGASNVRVSDIIPVTASFVSASAAQGACAHAGGVVTCDVGALAAGGQVQVQITVLPNLVSTMTNNVFVVSDEIDSNATNNSASTVVSATLVADVGVSVFNPGGVFPAGQMVSHLLTVTNRGPNSALNVVLTHSLPAGVSFVSGNASIGSCELTGGQVRCVISVVDAFTAVAVSLQVVPAVAGAITNEFFLAADSADFVSSNNIASRVLQVLLPPAITVQPQGGTFTNGSGVLLSVSGTGSAPLAHQWSRDGVEIPGATSATLSLPSITYADRGNYRVRLTNAVGAVTSAVASVVVKVRPTISDIANQTVNEDAGTGLLAFTVGDEDGSAGALTVEAFSSSATLVPANGLVLSGSGAARTLRVVSATNQSGTATITIRATDIDGLRIEDTFILTVNPVNDAPTILGPGDQQMDEDGTITVGIAVADVETSAAALTLRVSSSNPTVVSTNGLTLGGAGASRTLRIDPVRDAHGAAVITVEVVDAEGLIAATSFQVQVASVNDAPVLDGLVGPTVIEDSGVHFVLLSGIGSGAANETQVLTVVATSSVPALITNVSVNYSSPSNVAEVRFETFPNANGQAVITVTVQDDAASNNVVSRSFTVTVLPENDLPRFVGLTNLSALEDAGPLSVPIAVADVESAGALLQVIARSLTPSLIPAGAIGVSGSGAIRSLAFATVTNGFGSGIIELAVIDPDGGATTNQLVVTVDSVNDFPVVSPVADVVMNQDTASAPIQFVVADVETVAALLNVTGSTSDEVLFPAGSLAFGGSGAERVLTLIPAAGRHGEATITIRVADADLGESTTTFRVLVREIVPPSIVVQPVGHTVTNGAAVSFLVTVAGTLPISYQWLFNGAPLADATNAVLAIASAGPTDAGLYSVVVTNSGGSVSSEVIVLRVLVVPEILSVSRTEAGVEIEFPTFGDLNYTVEYADGSDPIGWVPLVTVPGTGGVVMVNDPSGELTVRLYRVRVE